MGYYRMTRTAFPDQRHDNVRYHVTDDTVIVELPFASFGMFSGRDRVFYAVEDPSGGAVTGYADLSESLPELVEKVLERTGYLETLDTALKAATADISLAADHSHLGVGTTVTGAALMAKGGVPHWAIFNVGDSRVYLSENRKLNQVTVDHSVVQELIDAGLLTEEEAETHPEANVVTRGVGAGIDPVKLGGWLVGQHRVAQTPITHPEFSGIRITPNVYTTLNEVDTFATDLGLRTVDLDVDERLVLALGAGGAEPHTHRRARSAA